jgi:hypothetical protein
MDRLIIKCIDNDLADRILASGPVKRPAKVQTKFAPRAAGTYRGAKRNFARECRTDALAAKRAGRPAEK